MRRVRLDTDGPVKEREALAQQLTARGACVVLVVGAVQAAVDATAINMGWPLNPRWLRMIPSSKRVR